MQEIKLLQQHTLGEGGCGEEYIIIWWEGGGVHKGRCRFGIGVW